jgi:hypothetical protein
MENKYRIQNLLVLVAFVIAIGLLTAHAKAGERKPSREDLANLEDIARNQTCLADNRSAHTRVSNSFRNKEKVDPKDIPSYNRFLDCKYWNELEVNALARNGWAVRWDTMELVQKDTNSPVRIHSSQDVNKPVVSNQMIDLSQFGEKDRLSHDQLITVLRDAGFNGKALEVAYAVARAESGHRPKAFNGNAKSGDKSYGIFQINMLGKLGPARRKQHGLSSNEELFHPEINARIAYKMSNGGTNWKPWSAYKNGAYQKYLNAF